jgi:hypothetical protein
MAEFSLVNFAVGGLTFVSALAVNDAMKETINSIYPMHHLNSAIAKLIYAVAIIIISIFLIIIVIKTDQKAIDTKIELEKMILGQTQQGTLMPIKYNPYPKI